jgi:DUF1009 family protein
MADGAASGSRRIGIVAGGGTLPFAVARSLRDKGDTPVLLAIEGYCDPAQLAPWRHHWLKLGKMGQFLDLLRSEQCNDIVCVGSLVRPALSEIRLDWQTIRAMPALIAAFRGGDDHLLTGISRILEPHGIHFVGIADIAPELTVPEGALTRRGPDAGASGDIAKGQAVLRATSAFDIGQAAVVIDGHVIALEDIEGTDALLARVARLRTEGRLRAPSGRGVLVKAPKAGQDLRFDLPALGPRTIEGAATAGLAGVAVIAGRTLIAEAEAVIAAADQAGLFVTGVPA